LRSYSSRCTRSDGSGISRGGHGSCYCGFRDRRDGHGEHRGGTVNDDASAEGHHIPSCSSTGHTQSRCIFMMHRMLPMVVEFVMRGGERGGDGEKGGEEDET
jgi:hypothetical protein